MGSTFSRKKYKQYPFDAPGQGYPYPPPPGWGGPSPWAPYPSYGYPGYGSWDNGRRKSSRRRRRHRSTRGDRERSYSRRDRDRERRYSDEYDPPERRASTSRSRAPDPIVPPPPRTQTPYPRSESGRPGRSSTPYPADIPESDDSPDIGHSSQYYSMATDPVARPITPAATIHATRQDTITFNHNPLPPPPKDVFNSTPYRTLLDLPNTSALLTANMSRDLLPGRRKKKSFWRNLVGGGKEREIRFVPIPANEVQLPLGQPGVPPAVLATDPAREAAGLTRNISGRSTTPAPSLAQLQAQVGVPPVLNRGVSMHAAPPQATMPTPAVVPSASQPVMAQRFDQHSAYASFLNHSPHRVEFEGTSYQTAAHLYEALKYLPYNPQLAQQIAACPSVDQVYELSSRLQQQGYERPDWPSIFLTTLRDVLLLKFKQHPDLRSLLLGTGNTQLIYADPDDPFWGDGGNGSGQNELGKLLVRVREQLVSEGFT